MYEMLYSMLICSLMACSHDLEKCDVRAKDSERLSDTGKLVFASMMPWSEGGEGGGKNGWRQRGGEGRRHFFCRNKKSKKKSEVAIPFQGNKIYNARPPAPS